MNELSDVATVPTLKTPLLFRHLSAVPLASAVIVAFIGILVLAGWSFEIDFLKSVIPGSVFMNPTTAVAFILTSIAMWLLQSADIRQVRIARVCAAVVGLIGLSKLCACAGFFDIGVDQIFYRNQISDSIIGQPNPMLTHTALNFLLLGAAFLLFNVRIRNFFPAQYPAIVVLLTSFVTLIGYLYGAQFFSVIIPFNPMAIHTTILFFILAAGLLLSRPEKGIIQQLFSTDTGGEMARRLFPVVIIIPALFGWLELQGEKADFYQIEMGNAMLVVAIIIVLGAIILNNARLMNIAASRRRKSEASMRQSEEKYRNILGSIEEGYFEIDLKGNFTFFNDALCSILGFDEVEVRSTNYRQQVDRANKKKLLAGLTKIFRTGQPISQLDWEIIRKDKTERLVESSISLIRDTALKPIGFRGFIRDVTGRKRAEDALRKSEEKNRELIENATDVIYTLDLSGGFTSINRAGEQIIGYTRAELLRMNFADIIAPKDVARVRDRIAKNIKGAGLPNFELEVISKDGSKQTLDISSLLILQDGVPVGIQGIGRDITERKRIEERLKAREIQLNEAQQIAHIGSWEWNIPENKVVWSDELYRISGQNPQTFDANFETFLNCVHPDDRKNVTETIERSLREKEFPEMDIRIIQPNGTISSICANGIIVVDENNAPVKMTGTCEDVTERRRVEAERQVISEIIEGVSTTSNLDELLEHVHQSIKKIIYAENCFVALYDEKTELLDMEFFVDEYDAALLPAKVGKGLTAYVFRNGQPLLANRTEIQKLNRQGEIELIGTPPAVWAGVPLKTPAGIIGVLVVQHYENENAYSPRDLELLVSVGDQIALAIERKQSEDELRQSREWLAAMFEVSQDGIIVEENEHVAFVNKRFLGMYNYAAEEIMGNHISRFLMPEDSGRMLEYGRMRLRGENVPSVYEFSGVDREGKKINLEASISTFTSNGKFYIVTAQKDITERREAEEALRKETALVELLKTIAIAANESESVEDALHICLDKVCGLMKWQIGHASLPVKDNPDELIAMPLWYFDDRKRFERVRQEIKDVRFRKGIGLIGRVLESGKAIWIRDVTKDPTFIYKEMAEEVGLKGSFAFPILWQSKVLGVLTFFSDQTEEPDEKLLEVMASIGNQLGQAVARKQSEERLLESELRYRLLFERNPNPIIIYDAETLGFLTVNEEAVRLYGYSHEEFRKMTLKDIRPPEDLTVLQKVLAQNEAGTDKFNSIRHQKKDGSIIEVDIILEPINFADRRAKLTLITDVTESKRAEKELQESQQLLKTVIDTLPQAIWWKDRESVYLGANRFIANAAGFDSPEEMIGLTDYDMPWSKDEADFYRERDRRVMDSGVAELNIVETMLQSDGSHSWLNTNKVPLLNSKGEIVGVIGAFIDITERKLAEEFIQNSRDYLDRIINAVADPIFVKNRQHRMVLVNDAFCQLTKHTREELIGVDFKDLVRSEEGRVLIEIDNLVFESGKEMSNQEEITDKHGNRRVQVTKKTLYTDQSGEQFIVGVINDITERKREETERQVIAEIVQGAITTSSLDELFNIAYRAINRIIPAENCYIALHDPANGSIRYEFWEDKVRSIPDPHQVAKSFGGYVLETRQPLLLTERNKQQLYDSGAVEKSKYSPSWMGVPLRLVTKAIGILVVQDYEKPGVYSERDLQMLGTIGDQLALAIERKRAEEAIRQSEEKYRNILETMEEGYYETDLNGKFIFFNDALCDSLGYSRDELMGLTNTDLMDEENAKLLYRFFKEVYTSNQSKLLKSWEIKRKNGERRMHESSLSLIRNPANETIGFRGLVRDITERQRIEEALEAAAQRERAMIVNALDVICTVDAEGSFISLNPACFKMWGYQPEELIGRQFMDFVTPEDVEKTLAEFATILAGEEATNFENRYVHKNGTLVDVRWTSYWSESEQMTFAMAHDITARKQIEVELEQARDAALESVRLKSEFLANMSHEIRTPMNGVIGMTGLLLDTNLSEEQRDYAETVQSSADGLLRIIDDILDFSKIEAGQLHFERIDFDLRDCVESPIELLAERAQSKGIEIASLVYRDVPTQLSGDPGRLRQILTNLIGNAVKFTETGEVTVKVRKQKDSGEFVTLRFEVADTGIGISEQAQSRLFRAFTQADGTTTRKYGGTGLGLAISKQLAEMMGGEIGIESAPGEGSTFWFTARLEKQANQTPVIRSVDDVSLEGVRVLIVDDNATNRKIFLHQTASWGMIAAEAESGKKALEMMRAASGGREPFEIAILDMMMPEMDGFELAHIIKSESALSGTHLVLLPSYGKRGDGQIARDYGIAAYIQKPVRQSQLYNCLMTVIAEASVGSGDGDDQSRRLITQHSLRGTTLPNSEPQTVISSARILIAEDNAVNQKVALSQLKSLGYTADVVTNGREAAAAVEKYQYDIVLMDCQMPEMDGFEATAEIRRFEGDSAHTTIVAMTAHALEGEREKCLAGGMDDYISKPVKVQTLKQTLKRWLAPIAAQTAVQPETADISASTKSRQSVDLSVLNGFKDLQPPDEPDIVTELIDLFLDDADRRITILKKAAGSRETVKINEQAHAIKGSSSNIGALQLAALSEKFEEKNLNTAQMKVLITQIESEFQEVTQILNGVRRQRG